MANRTLSMGQRGLSALALLTYAASASAGSPSHLAREAKSVVPRVLIVQMDHPATKDGDPNVGIDNFLAQEIEEGGRLSPIVWGMTDPIFREAATSGKLKSLPDHPKAADAVSVGRSLGAEYVVICDAMRTGADVKGSATLYRSGRQTWKDTITLRVGAEGNLDREGTALSVARTLAVKMTAGALKDLAVKPPVATPEPARGQAPVPVPTEPPVVAKTDNSKLRSNVRELLQGKRYSSAVMALRDAVDADPFDAERRAMLVDALRDQDPMGAAEEARRASELLPDKPEFRILAARAYMQAGKTKEAQDELNEAIARAPEATATRLLLAELALTQNTPEKALEHLDQAIKNEPTADGFFLRAVCRAMLGGIDGVRLDLEAMEKSSPEKSPVDIQRRYDVAIPILDRLLTRVIDDTRSMIQRAAVRPKDAELRDGLDNAQRLVSARVALLQGLPHSPDAQKSLDRWLLAHKLIAQTLVDIQTYIGGDPDAITDARMNLGEAIKQAAQARGNTPPKK